MHLFIKNLLIFLLVPLLVILHISILIIYDDSNGDFEEIRNNYKYTLYFIIVISSLGFMLTLYYLIRNMHFKIAAKLEEKEPIFQWNYEKQYWGKIKSKELKKNVLLYLLKISLIWIPIVSLLFYIKTEEPMVSFILSSLILVFTIPIIPFTLWKFIKNIRNQFFQKKYEVKIFKLGLTINEVYYPYRYYINSDNNLILFDIEETSNCFKFISKKTFYMPPTPEGGDSGSLITRTLNIFIPVPKCMDVSLDMIKKQVGVRNQTKHLSSKT